MPQAFDRELLHKLPPKPTAYKGDVIFIGSFTLGHHYRYELIEHLLNNNIDLALFGIGRENLPPDSKSYNKMQTPLYGLNMYAEYQHYKIAIHIHTTGIDNDGFDWNKYAGAKRVFEITGVGTMLITSQQENIGDMFKVDEEIVAFKDKDDLLHKIKFYLHHDDRREQIAMNGMRRTRQFHTFDNRAMELSKYL
jgi:spore maturation protein CgeB